MKILIVVLNWDSSYMALYLKLRKYSNIQKNVNSPPKYLYCGQDKKKKKTKHMYVSLRLPQNQVSSNLQNLVPPTIHVKPDSILQMHELSKLLVLSLLCNDTMWLAWNAFSLANTLFLLKYCLLWCHPTHQITLLPDSPVHFSNCYRRRSTTS